GHLVEFQSGREIGALGKQQPDPRALGALEAGVGGGQFDQHFWRKAIELVGPIDADGKHAVDLDGGDAAVVGRRCGAQHLTDLLKARGRAAAGNAGLMPRCRSKSGSGQGCSTWTGTLRSVNQSWGLRATTSPLKSCRRRRQVSA